MKNRFVEATNCCELRKDLSRTSTQVFGRARDRVRRTCKGFKSPLSLEMLSNDSSLLCDEIHTCTEQPALAMSFPLLLHPAGVSVACWLQWQVRGLAIRQHSVHIAFGVFDSPEPFFFPPIPPLPRINTVDWFSNITLPVALSTVSTTDVTAAALPLSRTSSSLTV